MSDRGLHPHGSWSESSRNSVFCRTAAQASAGPADGEERARDVVVAGRQQHRVSTALHRRVLRAGTSVTAAKFGASLIGVDTAFEVGRVEDLDTGLSARRRDGRLAREEAECGCSSGRREGSTHCLLRQVREIGIARFCASGHRREWGSMPRTVEQSGQARARTASRLRVGAQRVDHSRENDAVGVRPLKRRFLRRSRRA